MNPANLQLQGLLLAMASVLELMVRRGVITREELGEALRVAEHKAAEEREGLRQANVEAIHFPIRYLAEALSGQGNGSFAEVVFRVGEALDATRAREK